MPAVQGLGKLHSPLYAGEGGHMSPGEEKLGAVPGGSRSTGPRGVVKLTALSLWWQYLDSPDCFSLHSLSHPSQRAASRWAAPEHIFYGWKSHCSQIDAKCFIIQLVMSVKH